MLVDLKNISRISLFFILIFSSNLFGEKLSQERLLTPNSVIEDTLVKKNDGEYRQVYAVTLTNETLQAEFEVLESAWDINIYLSTKKNLNDYSLAEFAQVNREETEQLVINRFWGDGKLKNGKLVSLSGCASPARLALPNQSPYLQASLPNRRHRTKANHSRSSSGQLKY